MSRRRSRLCPIDAMRSLFHRAKSVVRTKSGILRRSTRNALWRDGLIHDGHSDRASSQDLVASRKRQPMIDEGPNP